MRAVKLCTNKSAVLNWRCRLTQVDLYNGRKTVVVVVVVILLDKTVPNCFIVFQHKSSIETEKLADLM